MEEPKGVKNKVKVGQFIEEKVAMKV